jgi:hypothetical protein
MVSMLIFVSFLETLDGIVISVPLSSQDKKRKNIKAKIFLLMFSLTFYGTPESKISKTPEILQPFANEGKKFPSN